MDELDERDLLRRKINNRCSLPAQKILQIGNIGINCYKFLNNMPPRMQQPPLPPLLLPLAGRSLVSDIAVAIPDHPGAYPWSALQNDARATTSVDMNGDGYLDIFLHPSYFTAGGALAPVVLLNDGKGGFTDGTTSVFKGIIPTIDQSNGVFIGDFTNDGRLSMFVVDQGLEIPVSGGFGGAVNHFYLQAPDGEWQDLSASLPGNGKAFNHVSSLTDFNLDGNLDVLVSRLGGANFDGSGTFVYLGDGKGGFTMSTAGLPADIRYTSYDDVEWNSTTIDYQFSGAAHAADLNNDGIADLVAGSYTDGDHLTGLNTVRFYTQDRAGLFTETFRTVLPSALEAQAGIMGVAGIDSADLDGDGLADVVVRWENQAWTAVEILRNLGNGRYEDVTAGMLGSYLARSGAVPNGLGEAQPVSYQLKLQDIDHDGNIDLLLQNFESNARQLASNTGGGNSVYLNDGTGHLVAPAMASGSLAMTAEQLSALAGQTGPYLGMQLVFDADNDGINDFIYLSGTDNDLHVATLYGAETGHIYTPRLGERLTASAANDTIIGGTGNTVVDGGAGRDVLVEAGRRTDYRVIGTGDGYEIVRDGRTEDVRNVERLQFADVNVALDINGTGGQVFRLYQAAYDRSPDLGGLGFWINAADSGIGMTDIAHGFTHSEEFVQLYGADVGDIDFVKHLYSNVLHRAPERSGFDFWVAALEAGVSREAVLSSFAESAENVAALAGVMQHGVDYLPVQVPGGM